MSSPEPNSRGFAAANAAAYRILDANLNRANEGFRVVEEYFRFVQQDSHLSGVCKQIRHDLLALARQLSTTSLHAMRDVAGDVGTSITTASEYQRADLRDVVAANMSRIAQSLRSLEEYAKVVAPQLASGFESLRYRTYELEGSFSTLCKSLERLANARLYVLVDGRADDKAFRALVTALLDGGVDVLQLRDKNLADRELFERAKTLREMTRKSSTLFIMNDRVDLALASGADGVHLGQDELPVSDARRLLGPDALIGVSTHRMEQARQAVMDGANYLGCGPTFPSATKQFHEFPGPDYLREVAREITLPAFAIGGINVDNVAAVRETGMLRIAVSSCVINARAPADAARELSTRLQGTTR